MGNKVDVELGLRAAGYHRGMEAARRSGRAFQKAAEKKLPNAFGLVGIPLSAAAAIAAIDAFLDKYDRIGKLSTTLQVPVEDMQRLALVAATSGTNLEIVAKGASRLQRVLGERDENPRVRKALQGLNIDINEFIRLKPTDQLAALADALGAAQDDTKAQANLNVLLGRTYVDLLPLLRSSGEQIRKTGNQLKKVLSKEHVKTIEEAKDAFEVFKVSLTAHLAVPVIDVIRWLGVFAQTLTMLDGSPVLSGKDLLMAVTNFDLFRTKFDETFEKWNKVSEPKARPPRSLEEAEEKLKRETEILKEQDELTKRIEEAKRKSETADETAARLAKERADALREIARIQGTNSFLGTAGPLDANRVLELQARILELESELGKVSEKLFGTEVRLSGASSIGGADGANQVEQLLTTAKEEKDLMKVVVEELQTQTGVLRSRQNGGEAGATFNN